MRSSNTVAKSTPIHCNQRKPTQSNKDLEEQKNKNKNFKRARVLHVCLKTHIAQIKEKDTKPKTRLFHTTDDISFEFYCQLKLPLISTAYHAIFTCSIILKLNVQHKIYRIAFKIGT